jgi:hypothetical protein
MGRVEAIAKLKEHEAELRKLGVEHLSCSARQRGATRAKIRMSISSSTMKRENLDFSSCWT